MASEIKYTLSNDQVITAKELAAKLNITRSAARYRLSKSTDVSVIFKSSEDMLSGDAQVWTLDDGSTGTVRAFAKQTGLKENTLRQRLKVSTDPEYVLENYKGKFLESCQLNGWQVPEVSFIPEGPAHMKVWTAEINFSLQGKSFQYKHGSLVKKCAEQLCYQELFEALSAEKLIGAQAKKSKLNAINNNANFKSALNEMIQRDNGATAEYSTVSAVSSAPIFTSTVSFNLQNKQYSFTGSSAGNKKEAEKSAAKKALDSLVGNDSAGNG